MSHLLDQVRLNCFSFSLSQFPIFTGDEMSKLFILNPAAIMWSDFKWKFLHFSCDRRQRSMSWLFEVNPHSHKTKSKYRDEHRKCIYDAKMILHISWSLKLFPAVFLFFFPKLWHSLNRERQIKEVWITTATCCFSWIIVLLKVEGQFRSPGFTAQSMLSAGRVSVCLLEKAPQWMKLYVAADWIIKLSETHKKVSGLT